MPKATKNEGGKLTLCDARQTTPTTDDTRQTAGERVEFCFVFEARQVTLPRGDVIVILFICKVSECVRQKSATEKYK